MSVSCLCVSVFLSVSSLPTLSRRRSSRTLSEVQPQEGQSPAGFACVSRLGYVTREKGRAIDLFEL